MASSDRPYTLGIAIRSPHLFSINGDTVRGLRKKKQCNRIVSTYMCISYLCTIFILRRELCELRQATYYLPAEDSPLGQKSLDPSLFIGAISRNCDRKSLADEMLISI